MLHENLLSYLIHVLFIYCDIHGWADVDEIELLADFVHAYQFQASYTSRQDSTLASKNKSNLRRNIEKTQNYRNSVTGENMRNTLLPFVELAMTLEGPSESTQWLCCESCIPAP